MRTQWSFAIVRNHCGLNLLKIVESSLIGVKYVMVSRNVKMPSNVIAQRYVLTQQNVQVVAYVMLLKYVMVQKNVQPPINVQVVRFTAPSLSPHANQ